MRGSTSEHWYQRWLVAVTLGVMAASLGMILAPGPTLEVFSALTYQSPDVIARFGQRSVEYITLMHAILGSVMLGWSTALLIVVTGPFRRREYHGWWILTVSVFVWFVPDTLVSLVYGFWQNAMLNVVVALFYAIPLAAIYRDFRERLLRNTSSLD
jgi:hypothetical protein